VTFREAHATSYLQAIGKSLDDKAVNLYKDRHLLSLRVAEENTNCYFRARFCAEMKKSVIYVVDIVLDISGVIVECQCECAVGMGPTAHCKHVCALFYGLSQISMGNCVVLHETCTQKLQTFNKCKRFKGSPQKSTALNLRPNSLISSIFSQSSYDPRASDFKNLKSYPAFFRNTCINFAHKSPTMPILQTVPPCNLYAFYNDHDYFCTSPESMCLQYLKVDAITPIEAEQLEIQTRGQVSNVAWKEERRKRIHSSNFGRICKATSRTDMDMLCKNLMTPAQFSTASVRYGLQYEAVAVMAYNSENNVQVRECGIFVCKALPFLAASPDGLVNDIIVLEVKCPYSARHGVINDVTVPYLVMENDSLCLRDNHDYYYQVQGQLLCTGREYCDFVVYTQLDMKTVRIKRNDIFISTMTNKLKHFYDNHFMKALLNYHLYRNSRQHTFNYKM
jgi:hypothetical protein